MFSAQIVLGALVLVVVLAGLLLVARALAGGPTGNDLYEGFGSLVTPVPADGYGEMTIVVDGTRRTLSARAEHPLPAGAPVYVLEVLSGTSVLVAPADPLALI